MRRRRHKYNNIIAKLKADADAAALKQSETTAKLRDEVRWSAFARRCHLPQRKRSEGDHTTQCTESPIGSGLDNSLMGFMGFKTDSFGAQVASLKAQHEAHIHQEHEDQFTQLESLRQVPHLRCLPGSPLPHLHCLVGSSQPRLDRDRARPFPILTGTVGRQLPTSAPGSDGARPGNAQLNASGLLIDAVYCRVRNDMAAYACIAVPCLAAA